MALVAGVDSSTQSCKVVVRDAETGALVRQASAPHPAGTEVHPDAWWQALLTSIEGVGGLDDVEAIAVAGQQHGMVCLDERGDVIRPALLWNDVRSAGAASDLTRELGDTDEAGRAAWVDATGSGLVASFTITKLRWLADNEPEAAARVAAVALPHDWLTWKLRGSSDIRELTTDRSDASGTGYWDPSSGEYRWDLLSLALWREVSPDRFVLPTVLSPFASAGRTPSGAVVAPGCGDNAGAALGLGLGPGQAMVSLGTSGVVAAVADAPVADPTGIVAGFADATGRFLPLACTLNASRILDAMRAVLGVDHQELSRLALAADAGAGGLVHIPYLEGERTPDLPAATGSLFGMTLASMTRENLARAAVEGLLCHMAGCVSAVRSLGIPVEEAFLVGGGARSTAVAALAGSYLGMPVTIPSPGEYVANGAAVQAATVLQGADRPVVWPPTVEVRSEGSTATEALSAYDRHADQERRRHLSDR
ncbi:FGGY family carbohydrate kinase [Mobilicoccus caccae]|uniref:Xylulose kinase n=1 Tax=Mobilicoccus caccae TaxID=1859295 RepID=A0ABQ6IY12_9MICO|nr:FGGY family carbohydrate kinase [Mobilicoccus caccae]GMA41602.1 xylulokinase [Mobilicoccus caccae]